MNNNNLFRAIPAVNKILTDLHSSEYWQNSILETLPQNIIIDYINDKLSELRTKVKQGTITKEKEINSALDTTNLFKFFEKKLAPKLENVINATGVVIHTNLGRSVLSEKSIEAIQKTASQYATVEFDINTGERGSRHSLVRELLQKITNAEDALVVNNNAAAVMLVLSSLAKGGETVISRGELVEVGGAFRIPDVMECSGSVLKDVGTTNKTHLEDYTKAINENTKALMRVHTSNFRIIGFTSQVPTDTLAKLAEEKNIPFIEDLGSGSFIDFSLYGLPKEPTVQEVVAQGVDIVTFSGDKLLGGPQAGIIVGKKKYIDIIKKNQLLRALRPCKLTFAALEATLKEYLNPQQAIKNIPTLIMLTVDSAKIELYSKKLADSIAEKIPKDKLQVHLTKDSSRVGGGAFPEAPLPTTLIELIPTHITAQDLKEKLLTTKPPIIGRLYENTFSLDVRTLQENQFPLIVDILTDIFGEK